MKKILSTINTKPVCHRLRFKLLTGRRINTKKFLVALGLLLVAFGVPSVTKGQSASFYISPPLGNYNIGDRFSLDVMINVQGASINVAEAVINFSPEKLETLEILKEDSIFSLWAREPEFSNPEGKIYFVGGLPSPGFIGEEGKVFTILFRAQDSGKVELSFSEERIVANDPKGENISSLSQEAVFYINVPEFEVSVDNEGDPTNPRPLLYLGAGDDDLKIDHYEVEIGGEVFKVKKEESLPWQIPALVPGEYLILVRVIEESGNVIENAAKVIIESIAVPEITFYPANFSSGQDVLYVSGNTMPDRLVLVILQEDGMEVKKWQVNSDSQGSWFLRDDILLRPGVYKISAQTKDLRGAVSYPSKSYFMSASLSGVMLGPLMITYKALAFVTILLLFLIFNWLSYLLFKMSRNRKLIKIEIEDLKNKFYKEYYELKRDIGKQLGLLRERRSKEGFTEEEEEREKELLKNLDDVERVLREELKDIEKIG